MVKNIIKFLASQKYIHQKIDFYQEKIYLIIFLHSMKEKTFFSSCNCYCFLYKCEKKTTKIFKKKNFSLKIIRFSSVDVNIKFIL